MHLSWGPVARAEDLQFRGELGVEVAADEAEVVVLLHDAVGRPHLTPG